MTIQDIINSIGPCTRHVQSDEVTAKLAKMREEYCDEEEGIEILERIVKGD